MLEPNKAIRSIWYVCEVQNRPLLRVKVVFFVNKVFFGKRTGKAMFIFSVFSQIRWEKHRKYLPYFEKPGKDEKHDH